jgi:Uma2 family endonuclease
MASTKPRDLLEAEYSAAAQAYLRDLPPEHFMEAVAQATQRKITLVSLELVRARRPDVQVFNELLVQYPLRGHRRPRQVVPDNMVVVYKEPIQAKGSFDVPTQPVGPFWVLEYVSKYNQRKDYDDNFDRYEKELKVPYYLIFYPDGLDLTLFHLGGKKYKSVVANEHGRYAIPELNLEVGLLNEWARFWHRGELLPLPGEWLSHLDQIRTELGEERCKAERERQRAEQLQHELDHERQARREAEREVSRLKSRLEQSQKKS